MDRLFAPWRIEWVEREESAIDGCPFCVLPEWDSGRESLVVAENDRAFVLLNNYPYNPGHVMVIPRTHTGDFRDLSAETLAAHARLKQHCLDAFEAAFEPDGVNMGCNLGEAAGGSIDDHVHTHVVPRWHGDTNFMATISDTKLIVEAVAETYDRLREAFADLPAAETTGDDDPVRLSAER
ncbi:MAG: HIT domain-containing protein [Natronomonas sp.]